MDETATDSTTSNIKIQPKGLQTNKLNMVDSQCGYHLLSDSIGQVFCTLVTSHGRIFIPPDFS